MLHSGYVNVRDSALSNTLQMVARETHHIQSIFLQYTFLNIKSKQPSPLIAILVCISKYTKSSTLGKNWPIFSEEKKRLNKTQKL